MSKFAATTYFKNSGSSIIKKSLSKTGTFRFPFIGYVFRVIGYVFRENSSAFP